MTKRTLLAAGLIVFVAVLPGCGSDSSDPPDLRNDQSKSDANQTQGDVNQSQGDVSDAVTALQTAGSAVAGQPFDIETETRNGRDVWEVKVAVKGEGHELWISPDGTKVIDRKKHDTPDDDVQKVESAKINAVKALRKASARYAGTLDEMEIDSHRGRIIWEVELRQSGGDTIELEVDATSGEVATGEN